MNDKEIVRIRLNYRNISYLHSKLFAQYRKLHKFATTNSNFEKKAILLNIHHHKMYMYINFQQN